MDVLVVGVLQGVDVGESSMNCCRMWLTRLPASQRRECIARAVAVPKRTSSG